MFGKKMKKQKELCAELEGVITFFGSHHALRAEKQLKASGLKVVLIPGPREISPNCGVALRFDFTQSDECRQILEKSSVQFEEIHHYPARE